MPTLVIVGAQWGDEAKGKVVDVLGSEASTVVRYSGGNNAGHTIVVGDRVFKFHLIPAGILHPGCTAVLASGMVICPQSLLEELERTRQMCPELGSLKISAAAHVVFPYHRKLDALEEEARGQYKIGTTTRGIGPAYEDKVARIGIRMCEFVRPERFRQRLYEVLTVKNRLLKLFGEPEMQFELLYEEYAAYAKRLSEFVTDTDRFIQQAVARNERVLFEGAQGTFLDLDVGTYPYVTSSHPIAGGACLGTGIGPRAIDSVLGVCKAYTTRVGSGPFPTEQANAVGDQIREQGSEYGTTTGRPRRCGWLDLVALRQSSLLNSMSGLIVTRLDVLSNIGKLRVAASYRLEGEPLEHMPSDIGDLSRIEPVYRDLDGWCEDLRGMRKLEELPGQARRYLELIEERTETPIAIVSIGPDREETIVLRPELVWG